MTPADQGPLPAWVSMCPKCAVGRPSLRYHSGSWSENRGTGCGYYDQPQRTGEHLHATCQSCGYTWTEPVRHDADPLRMRPDGPMLDNDGRPVDWGSR